MRVFIGIFLPDEVKGLIQQWQESQNLNIRWIPPENWHITLVPPWNANESDIPAISQKISGIALKYKLMGIQINRIELGPNAHVPRLIWAGCEAPREFFTMQKELESKFGKNSGRDYRPHITLARIKDRIEFDSQNVNWDFQVKRISLIESRLTPKAAIYRNLYELYWPVN